jgi:hypothetical protein
MPTTRSGVYHGRHLTHAEDVLTLEASGSIIHKVGGSNTMLSESGETAFYHLVKTNTFQTTAGGMYVDSNGRATDCAGSFHVSGAYGSETRKIPLTPIMMIADDDYSSGKGGVTSADGGAYNNHPSVVSDVGSKYILGTRMSSSSAEGYVFGPPIPANWQIDKVYLSIYDIGTTALKELAISCVSRTWDTTGATTIANITTHLATTTAALGSNGERSLTVPYIPNGDSYFVITLPLASTDIHFMGGYCLISRV